METSPGSQPNQITSILMVIGLGVLAVLPAIIFGVPLGADLDNHFRFALPLYDEILAGNPFPGWLAESNNGFGDPRFRFYPPLLYYLLAAARVMSGDWYTATLATFTLLSIVGCAGIYLWMRLDHGRKTALAAVALFCLLPYHAAQFYQASLLAEYAAMSFLPFAFLFLDRLSRPNHRARPNILAFGLSFALIVLVHIPMTIVGSIGLGLFTLFLTDWRGNKRFLLYAAVGIGVGLALSSFFWLTLLNELSWIQGGQKAASEYYDYRNNFLFSPFSVTNLNTFFGTAIAALTLLICLPMILKRYEWSRSLRAAIFLAAFAVFMTTDLSRPLWAVVPKLSDIQFPFRWLAVASVAICPAVAFAYLCFWSEIRTGKARTWKMAVCFVSLSAIAYSVWEFTISTSFLNRETFSARIEASRAAPSFREFLPVGAAEIKDVKPMNGPIDIGDRQVLESDVATHRRRFKIAAGPETEARIRAYYYPLWQATINGNAAPTEKAPDGILTVNLPAEECELTVVFGN